MSFDILEAKIRKETVKRIKNDGREFSDFHISLLLRSVRSVNCSLWSVTVRQYCYFTVTIESQFIWHWILHLFTFQILLIIFRKKIIRIHEPGSWVLFELGIDSPWSLPTGKIKEAKLKSIIQDGLKSYLLNEVLLISSIACFLQRSFSSFIRIRCTGYKDQYYLSLALHSTRCINVTRYNPVINWFPIKGNQKFYYSK